MGSLKALALARVTLTIAPFLPTPTLLIDTVQVWAIDLAVLMPCGMQSLRLPDPMTPLMVAWCSTPARITVPLDGCRISSEHGQETSLHPMNVEPEVHCK